MKLWVSAFLSLLLSALCAAQDVCVLESKTAPSVHNLRLEMTPEQVRSVLGRELKIKIKKTGEQTFFQNFIGKRSPQSIPGVRALYLRFFNGRLYQIEIFYENSGDSQPLSDWTALLSATMNLPAAWQIEKGRAMIKCSEISLVADNVLNPRIEITDETARAKVEESRKRKG